MIDVFRNSDFWILYLNLFGSLFDENEELIRNIENPDLKQILAPLASEFEVVQELVKKKHEDAKRLKELGLADWIGKEWIDEKNEVVFEFSLGDFSLVIESSFHTSGCKHYLYLYFENKKHMLGWWDAARWHPYCLKYDEFLLLLKNIKKYDATWKDSSIPLLLLMRFVGFGKGEIEQHKTLNCQAQQILKNIDIKHYQYLPTCAYNEYYTWVATNLGWQFTGKYTCYSLRNEEQFPFKLWHKLIQTLK